MSVKAFRTMRDETGFHIQSYSGNDIGDDAQLHIQEVRNMIPEVMNIIETGKEIDRYA